MHKMPKLLKNKLQIQVLSNGGLRQFLLFMYRQYVIYVDELISVTQNILKPKFYQGKGLGFLLSEEKVNICHFMNYDSVLEQPLASPGLLITLDPADSPHLTRLIYTWDLKPEAWHLDILSGVELFTRCWFNHANEQKNIKRNGNLVLHGPVGEKWERKK